MLLGLAGLTMCAAELPFFYLSGPLIRRIGPKNVVALAQIGYLLRLVYYSVRASLVHSCRHFHRRMVEHLKEFLRIISALTLALCKVIPHIYRIAGKVPDAEVRTNTFCRRARAN